MSRTDPHVRIRLPEELRVLLKQEASSNGRSMNAEIVARLGGSSKSLRDEFAMAALAYVAERAHDTPADVAVRLYGIADAMLAERSEGRS